MNSRFVFVVGVVSFIVAGLTSSFGQQAASHGQESEQNAALSFNIASITGRPGQTIPMNISVIGAAQNPRGFAMIRGIPSQFKLSSGFLSGNAWLTSISELDNLQLIVPDEFAGRFEIEVMFVLADTKQRQIRSASITIQPERQPKDRLRVLEEGKQAQKRSAPDIALPERRPKDRVQSAESGNALPQVQPAAAPPTMLRADETNMMNAAAQILKNDDMAPENVGAPLLAANLEPPRLTSPDDRPISDKAPIDRNVAEFCYGQRQICRKVCYMRYRDDLIGCPQICESRVVRCVKTGCYRWTDPDFVLAEHYGGRQCPQ